MSAQSVAQTQTVPEAFTTRLAKTQSGGRLQLLSQLTSAAPTFSDYTLKNPKNGFVFFWSVNASSLVSSQLNVKQTWNNTEKLDSLMNF